MTEQFKDCPECPDMVVVPAGEFMMGSPASELERSGDETQVRATIAQPFAVGKFAVTFDEWDACLADGGCNGYRPGDQGWGRGKRPVINVNWDDVKAYATWLSRKTGKIYRLLSEAEREYVTRAGTTTPFWWGSSITPKQANYDGSAEPYKGGGSKGEYRKATVPVDSFEANPWGLYQVHGNVWEWTEDCWNDSNTGNPGNGIARATGDYCNRRVLHGGSWFSLPLSLRAAFRSGHSTVDRFSFDGFRLARTISAELNQGRVREAAEAWVAIKDTTNIPTLEAYIARFPDTFYADQARTRMAELKKQVAPGAPSFNVSDDLDELNRRIRELNSAGKYGEAIPLAEKSLELTRSQKGEDQVDTAARMNWLAELYHAQGRYAEAEPLCKRALAIREKALGPDHPGVGTSLNNLAELYRAQGRTAEAEPLHKRALAIREKALGPDHPGVGTSLNNLAELYRAQGRTAEAEPLFTRSLAIFEKALGPDHPFVGTSLNSLAEMYRAQGRTAEAEPLCKRALAIAEKALGPDHPHVGTSLNSLALLYQAQGHYAEAEPLFTRSLTIFEKALGPDHPHVGTSLNNLAELYRAQGRTAEAEPLFTRSLAIFEKALGPDHPHVGTSLNNLAELYRAQGRTAEAEPLHKRALAIAEKARAHQR
jgi:formylglycine-generating enzyme required for sulfatase activity/tetratricopeptide (TPR) repeat protein